MDKKTRIILIVGGIITLIVVPVVATLLLSSGNNQSVDDDRAVVSNPNQLPDRSNDDLAKAINDQSTELKSTDSTYTFVIMEVKQPEKGWYIVKIRPAGDDSQYPNTAVLLLQDIGERLNLLLGPGTNFEEELTQSLGIPDNVAEELNAA